MKFRSILILFIFTLSIRADGYYIGSFIFCNSDVSCRHEIGHMMDYELGSTSKSLEFAEAIRLHLYVDIAFSNTMDDISVLIFNHGGIFRYDDDYDFLGVQMFSSPQQELYANMYTMVNGDVSKLDGSLLPYFSNDSKYIELYECLMKKQICNGSIRLYE